MIFGAPADQQTAVNIENTYLQSSTIKKIIDSVRRLENYIENGLKTQLN